MDHDKMIWSINLFYRKTVQKLLMFLHFARFFKVQPYYSMDWNSISIYGDKNTRSCLTRILRSYLASFEGVQVCTVNIWLNIGGNSSCRNKSKARTSYHTYREERRTEMRASTSENRGEVARHDCPSPRRQSPTHKVVTRGARESGEKCGGPRLLPVLLGSPSRVRLPLPQDVSWISAFLGLPEWL
ncbi:PREDICTED: uncharacterized protein LOC104984283 isoform X3 [Bison bison bison]|uniref:Uncharacterized protein LOC104984283 isoform X3 n=1 Tax=Bison bison bison TaxID=43346 RepID=A0A6P3GL09_BISBB|nr:PREDICTED: uncharacterized protein LOC104984283 isoform X3 [Bison bison bison]